MTSKINLISLVIIIAAIIGGALYMNMNQSSATRVLLKTTMGDITIELFPDMPVTAGNFEKLVRAGYYDGVIFHRVMAGFMVQGGDPTGTGAGGPGTNGDN